jgi:hypothetical protein
VTTPTDDTLVSLAAYGLAGSMLDAPSGPFAPDDWFHLLAAARDHGLVGILAAAAHDGEIKLSGAQSEELSVVEREAAGLALLVEQQVVRTSGLLAAAGLVHRVIGGPPRGRLGYRHLGFRTFTEATMLVEPEAVHLLGVLQGGSAGSTASGGSGADGGPASTTRRSRIHLAVAVPAEADGGVQIDVGRMADPPTLLVLADRPVPTGSIEEHLVLACLEVAARADAGGLDLVARRDITELSMFPAIDADRVRQVCEVWGVTDLVTHELAATWRFFELADRTPLSVWAARGDAPDPGGRSRRPGRVVGRMVDRLAPGSPGPRTARRVQ